MPTIPFPQLNQIIPDPLRAKIYESALQDAYNLFTTSASSGGYSTRFHTALCDLNLLATLASMLDEYVLCGVAADLSRCRTALYGPTPVPVPPATAVNIDTYVGTTLPMSPPSRDDQKLTPSVVSAAYQSYFNWFILPAAVLQGSSTKTGIEAFQERHPMTQHAVTQISTHFCANIQQACIRINADWDLITNIFFPDNPPRELVKITSTGSDFHKGGKQVLLLTFRMNDNSMKKLVYKPSDIEADYRLFGMTAPVLSNNSLALQLSNWQSLSEELNTYLNDDYKLPTYRILPRNPGSGLAPTGGTLPIDTSYGYIEFLTNNPVAQPDSSPLTWNPKQASDWVTSTSKDIERFYRQVGRLCALACVFSVSDLHVDNLIVHLLQPHLIDAEISFTGPMNSIAGTFILDPRSGALISTEHPSARRQRYNDQTANLLVSQSSSEVTHSPGHNRIFFAKSGNNPVLATAKDNATHIITGFLEMLTAMRDNQTNLVNWLTNPLVQNMVTRFTPEATPFFQQQLRLLYSPTYCSTSVPSVAADYDAEPYQGWKNAVQTEWSKNSPIGRWPAPRPNYALASQDNNFADYLNCDVPAYYHRVGSLDLMNSRGQNVTVQPPPVNPPISRNTYFPQSTFDIVRQQIDTLQQPEKLKSWVDTSIQALQTGLGMNPKVVQGLWKKFTIKVS